MFGQVCEVVQMREIAVRAQDRAQNGREVDNLGRHAFRWCEEIDGPFRLEHALDLGPQRGIPPGTI